MKGCLGLLLLMFGLIVAEYFLLRHTPLAGSIGLPIISAVLIVFALTQLFGLRVGLQRRAALRRPPNGWRDGEFVGIGGQIGSDRTALIAPGSGLPSALFEYRLVQTVRRQHGNRAQSSQRTLFQGMAMAGCSLRQGPFRFRLFGFPLLSGSAERHADPAALRRIAAYLLDSEPRPSDLSLRESLREFAAVLQDDDGIVRHDAACRGAPDLAGFRRQVEQDHAAAVDALAAQLLADDCHVEEQRIAEGSEVVAYGRFEAGPRAIHVGSGMQHLEHGLLPGAAASVSRRELRRALILLVLFGGLAIGLHAWLLPPLWRSASAAVHQGSAIGFDDVLALRFDPAVAADLQQRAVRNDQPALLQLLFDLGSELPAADSELLFASRDASVVDELLRRGADASARDPHGVPLLLQAVRRREPELIDVLLRHGAAIDAVDVHGSTALHEAVEQGELRVVDTLLAAGADPAHRNAYGGNALKVAIEHGQLAIARRMLERGVEVDVADERGYTALMHATTNGDLDAVQMLLAAGADPQRRTPDGLSLIDLAADEEQQAQLRDLLQQAPSRGSVERDASGLERDSDGLDVEADRLAPER
jgi:ankyrin repeat protein